MKLTHELFVEILRELQLPVVEGVCHGYQMMLVQHLCDHRLHEFVSYLSTITEASDLESLLRLSNSRYNSKLKNFFEEIAHYQYPPSFKENTNLEEDSQQFELVAKKLSSRKPSPDLISQVPLKTVYQKSSIFNRAELGVYLNDLVKILNQLRGAPIAILLSNSLHTIGIQWDAKLELWSNSDINLIGEDSYLKPIYKTSGIVESIFDSLFDTEGEYTGFTMSIITSEIYHAQLGELCSLFASMGAQDPVVQSERTNSRGTNLLQIAADTLSMGDVNRLLSVKGINPNPLSDAAQSLLHIACIKRSVELVKALMAHPDTDPDVRDIDGFTPLDIACLNNDASIVRELLTHKSVKINEWNGLSQTPLYTACHQNGLATVECLLTHPDIDPNEWSGDQLTPLHTACYLNNVEVVKVLLDHEKILPHQQNGEGSPLETATLLGFTEIQNAIHAYDLKRIQKAVKDAQLKYSQWYGGASHRGPNGFFTWFRHGNMGQHNAVLMSEAINATSMVYDDAKLLVNTFLIKHDTRYHRHSFASFLLDELNQIDGSPWSNIKCSFSSKLYDKNDVISALSELEIAAQYNPL